MSQQEEELRRQAEMERLRQIEEKRLRDLENQADRWFKSNQLRQYISAVETAALERGLSIEDDPLKSWLKWAKNHANSFDPLFNNLPFENEVNGNTS
jgi:membrane protein involved in colicin uptake